MYFIFLILFFDVQSALLKTYFCHIRSLLSKSKLLHSWWLHTKYIWSYQKEQVSYDTIDNSTDHSIIKNNLL